MIKLYRPILAIMIAFLALAGFLGFIGSLEPVEAAPNATEVFTLRGRGTSIITTTTTDPIDVSAYDTLYVQYEVDQGTTSGITITVEHSVNGWAYVTHTRLITDDQTDGSTGVVKFTDFGRYIRATIDMSTTNEITPSLVVLATGSR